MKDNFPKRSVGMVFISSTQGVFIILEAFKIKRLQFVHLADVLRLRDFASHGSQVAAQGAAEELEQHLKADAGESWVVAAPREFFWLVFLFFSSQLWPRVSPSF